MDSVCWWVGGKRQGWGPCLAMLLWSVEGLMQPEPGESRAHGEEKMGGRGVEMWWVMCKRKATGG